MLKHAHSGLRWVALVLLIWAIANAFSKFQSKKAYEEKDRKIGLFTLISVHLQLILGLILYFISPYVQLAASSMKNTVLRFYTVEHLSLMLIAIILITVGYSKAKRKEDDAAKFKTTYIFYGIGLLLILLAIPWPFRGLGAGWF